MTDSRSSDCKRNRAISLAARELPDKRLQFEQTEPLYYSATSARLLLRQQLFVIQQMGEPFPDIARLVKMPSHAMRAPAH